MLVAQKTLKLSLIVTQGPSDSGASSAGTEAGSGDVLAVAGQ